MKKIISSLIILFTALQGFGQASDMADFTLGIKFDRSINIDSIHVAYYETLGQNFNAINYSIGKSSNSITVFGNNDYIVGTKFPTLIFSYATLETMKYLCKDSLQKSLRVPCTETIETTQLFYLISGHYLGSYNEAISSEIKFTKTINSILITKDSKKGFVINKANTNESKEMICISNKVIKINKK